MKNLICTLIIALGMLILIVSCKHANKRDDTKAIAGTSEVMASKEASSDLIVVAKDIITEVIVKPDTLGDPWEVEKVKNYNGKQMLSQLFDNIYSKKLTVYDIQTGKPLDPAVVRKTEKEFGSDISKIGKIQFLEDWYFNPSTNKIIKKIKSVSFAYEYIRSDGLPVGYKALFRLNIDQ